LEDSKRKLYDAEELHNFRELVNRYETLYSDKLAFTYKKEVKSKEYINKTYSDLEALASAYKSACKNENGNGSGGGGSSSGGGSKNSGNSMDGYQVAPEIVVKEEQNAQLPMDIFTDIDTVEWAKEAIVYLAEKSIINGKGDGIFCPLDKITREEFTKLVVGAFFRDAEEKEVTFADVDGNAWYTPYVKKAYGAGIITGFSETEFGIGENISREDVVVILNRVALKKGIVEEDERTLNFEDEALIADYAKSAVAAMADIEIVTGKEIGIFAPKDTATRAETAKMIYRLIMK